jgi:hypothetical protein
LFPVMTFLLFFVGFLVLTDLSNGVLVHHTL